MATSKKPDPTPWPMANTEPAQKETRPVPDPTVLTTQQLVREIGSSREIIEAEITGLRDTFDQRLGAIDRAVETAHNRINQVPQDVRTEVSRLENLHAEKFESFDKRLMDLGVYSERRWDDSKLAIKAAFEAQKELGASQNAANGDIVKKMESGFSKQFEQMGQLFSAGSNTTDGKIDALKERFQTLEVRMQALESAKKGGGEVWGVVGTIAGVVFGALATAATALYKH